MKRLNILILLLLLLVGCRSTPPSGHPYINWVDFVKWNGKEYEGIYSGILADEKFIGEKLGEVKFKVADNVTHHGYKIKDGDAAFHEKGTEVYSIKGNPDLLAVKDKSSINGYSVYYARDENEYRWHFKNVPIEKVHTIEIYQHYTPNMNMKKIAEFKDKDEVNSFMKILNDSKENPNFQVDMPKGGLTYYEMILYTNEPIAYRYHMQFDGTTYFWCPWEISILPNKIEAFIKRS